MIDSFTKAGLSAHILILSLMAGLFLTACASTAPAPIRPQPPIVEAPQPIPDRLPPPTELPDNTSPPTQEPDLTPAEPQEPIADRDGLTPPHMKGRDIKRLALLLPFSAKSKRLQDEANSMLKAAEMAIFNRDEADILLIALDTGGSETGAASATQAAIRSGVDVILGPVLARSVRATSREVRSTQTPVIAFSTDQTVAGRGTYLLSFPPEAEVRRIVDYAASTGVSKFAFLGPSSAYGRRVKSAYEAVVSAGEGEVSASRSYDGNDISVMQQPARELAEFYKSQEVRTPELTRQAFEAILLPESGVALRSLAPLLPYYDLDPDNVQFMGTSLWHRDETVREPALNRGIFAGPDQEGRQSFIRRYDQIYGEDPSRLASLAYDAITVGAFIADGNPATRHQRALDPNGFYGVDGFIRFNGDGTPNRGLAVYQIQNGRFVIIDPAPNPVTDPS